jgi:hypothetical protein
MGDIHKKHPPTFKLKVAADAISGHNTLAQLSSTDTESTTPRYPDGRENCRRPGLNCSPKAARSAGAKIMKN